MKFSILIFSMLVYCSVSLGNSSCLLGNESKENKVADFSTLSNSSNSTITFNFDNKGQEVYIHIYDALGKEIIGFKTTLNTNIVNVYDYENGLYFYKIKQGDKTLNTGKLLISDF